MSEKLLFNFLLTSYWHLFANWHIQPSTLPGLNQYLPFQLYNSSSNNNNNTSNGSSNTSDFLSGHLLFPSENIFETAAKLLFMSVKWSKSVPSFLQVSLLLYSFGQLASLVLKDWYYNRVMKMKIVLFSFGILFWLMLVCLSFPLCLPLSPSFSLFCSYACTHTITFSLTLAMFVM